MEIEGRIIADLPLQSGTSRAGNPWKKKEWVLETFGQYPKKVCFNALGDRIDQMQLEVGKDYSVSIDIESREYNGRWYTDVRAFAARPYVPAGGGDNYNSVPPATPVQPVADPYTQPQQGVMNAPQFSSAGNDAEDLPF